jgi:P2 family phage major capsid protein
MKKETRFKFNAFLSQLAKLNNVDVGTLDKKFNVEPSVTQTLMTRLQESSEFLTRINIIPVDEMMGAKVGVGVTGTIASTTNTDAGDERETADFTKLDQEGYHCTKTNYDFHWMYSKLDLWARYNDFQTRLRDAIIKRQALDRILVGFNGVSRAPTSNRVQNPLLQDVGVGWLQKYRLNAPSKVMGMIVAEDGTVTNEAVKVGGEGEYKNLDALVFDAVNELVDPIYQDDTELVVICGRKLLADKYFPLINKQQPNTEAMAADLIISQKRIGNLPAVRVPGFPANAMLITRLDNLSIYWQDGTHRRHVEEVPKRDRIENYESINEDYVVEDYGCGCLIENIEVTAGEDDADEKAELSKFTSTIVDAIKTASGAAAPAAQE